MAVEHERHRPHEYQDYIDRSSASPDASGWGLILGVAALLAILGLLFIGMGSTPDSNAPQPTTERSAPAPTQAPTQQPANPSPAPN